MASPNLKYTSKLQNSRVLIIGGTSGLGFAVAEAVLEHGADVIISSSNPAKLEKTVDRLKEAYPSQAEKQSLTTHACDLSDVSNLDVNIEKLLKAATDNGVTKLNHIVFTAGDALERPAMQDITPDLINKASTVRYVAPMILAKHISNFIEISPASSYTLTGGASSHRPRSGWPLGAGLAAGAEGLMRGLAVELKPVRVNLVQAAAVHTELFANFPAEKLDDILESFANGGLTGTVGTPEDVAEAYIYLMKCHYATGSIVEANGGYYLGRT
jgi:NAD(P)-dependent dehydrogenase (short-subunit alcohol dehydrogenase family)